MPNKLLEDFNKSKELLFEHVGFVEDGGNYPMEDCFDYYYWKINNNIIIYCENKEELISGKYKNIIYEEIIYEDHLFPQSIFIGKELTMIIVNSIDGRYLKLLFLDNAKEIK